MAKAGDLFKSFGKVDKPVVSTGILGLDVVLGKGFALGGMYGLGSGEGSGKSTLMLQMCKHHIDVNKLNVVYVDVEQGITEEILESVGLLGYPQDKFFLVQDCVTFSDLQRLTNQLIAEKKEYNFSVMIVDSLTAVAPQKIVDGDVESAKVAPSAKPMSEYVKAVRGRLGVARIGCVLIGQARVAIGAGMWEPDTYVALPKAVQHAVDVMLTIEHKKTKSTQIWSTKNTPTGLIDISVGFWGKMWTLKNKKGLDSIKIPMPMIFGKGFDNVRFVVSTLTSTGLMVKYGEKYTMTFADNIKIEGESNMYNYVATNYANIVGMLYEKGFYDLTNEAALLTVANTQVDIPVFEKASTDETYIGAPEDFDGLELFEDEGIAKDENKV